VVLVTACQSSGKLSDVSYTGAVINPPRPVKDFVLTDQTGQEFRLNDHRDSLKLIFFGYTNCPDVCPITLAEMVQVKRVLGAQAAEVTFLMITVDPERDTPEVMGRRLAVFDPAFVGLTGDRDMLQPVWQDLGIYSEREEVAGSTTGYLVAHTASLLLVDREGKLRLIFPYGTPSDDIVSDIVQILQ
jgi:protein SCO1/2